MSLRMTLPPSGSGNPVFFQPPRTHIGNEMEAFIGISELTLVDQEALVGSPMITLARSGQRNDNRFEVG